MLHLITGVPGASKTAFAVTKLDDIERKNKVYLKKNMLIYEHNKKLYEKYHDDFSYYVYETGSAHELKSLIEVLPDDYFDFFGHDFDDLRPDYYFLRSVRYNEIIDRINEREGHQDFQYFKPVRTIYSNINALKIDYCRALIKDWRDAPDGSIFVIDEVQLVEPYSEIKQKDPIVQDLTIHRHRGFDFYFITQAPAFLHPTVRDLVGVHYHITRPYGRTPKVYQYGSTRQYPNTLINKLNCESKFSFKPQDRIFKLYKSTTINTHEKRLPAGLIPLALFGTAGFAMFMWGMSDKTTTQEPQAIAKDQQNHTNTTNKPGVNSQNNNQAFNADFECRKAENVEKPECVQWFNNLKNSNGSIIGGQNAQVVKYDASKPFDLTQVNYQYTVKEMPQFAGCVKFNGKYYGYTQQATRLEISQSDCRKVIENGERPFNPFRDPQIQVQQQNNQSTQQDQSSETIEKNQIYNDQQRVQQIQKPLVSDQVQLHNYGGV
ncbi:zonular occludens toxin domain-containing protein [Acinetobacter qingfengensis]|uniref:zonular occludens toxin domain-containing protein n=2 Tax=Acinetobacter qingfengensis TaxID=1262585 RepID=UPI0009D6E671|nr:zonular occludens toxin domain-containing protein [Acinetobacter qingfengensis]